MGGDEKVRVPDLCPYMEAPRQQPTNYERLLQLAEDAFAMRSDPAQLQVDEHVLEHLRQLHPATVCEPSDTIGGPEQ